MAKLKFIRGTTPTIRINETDDMSLAYVSELLLTLEQGELELNKLVESADFTASTYTDITLTQEETLSFAEGKGQYQVRCHMIDRSKVKATEWKEFEVLRTLNEEIFDVTQGA